MTGRVLLSIQLTARLAGVTVQAVRAAIRRGRLTAVTLARAERTAVRGIDLHDAVRYYGWPPALAHRLADEMRAGVPEGEDVYRIDSESKSEGEALGSGPEPPESAGEPGLPSGPTLNPDPSSTRDAWKRAAKKLAARRQMPNDAPPGFRLVLPREHVALAPREVHDLVVDGEVVGTLTDPEFARYVLDRCEMGEVFVDGHGSVKWRPRLPLSSEI